MVDGYALAGLRVGTTDVGRLRGGIRWRVPGPAGSGLGASGFPAFCLTRRCGVSMILAEEPMSAEANERAGGCQGLRYSHSASHNRDAVRFYRSFLKAKAVQKRSNDVPA